MGVSRRAPVGSLIIAMVKNSAMVGVSRLVRSSHERWDGGGYPDGLAGEEIPLGSRVVFVCDAFHAMTSDRPYRGRMPLEVAYEQLEQNAGSQFDPDVVAAFLRLGPESLEAHPV